MGPEKPSEKGEKGRTAKQLALLTAIPAILAVSPLIGFFIGQWLDKKFETAPLWAIVGVIIGFAAAGVEIRGLIKKGLGPDKDDEKQN